MKQCKSLFYVFLIGLMLFPVGLSFAQESAQAQFTRRFRNGTELFALSRMNEAVIEFRRAEEIAQTISDWSAALYWVILSELALSDYGSALRDMDRLERYAPNSSYARDIVYHRGRIYHILGFYEEAIVLLNHYVFTTTDSDRVTADRRAAAFFWIGECLFAMRQFDEAEKFYSWVIARYHDSPKMEASSYRLDLIKQKRIEAELLALLQLSHEEALRTSEEYQRTIRTYEHTLNQYQRRIIELTTPVNQTIQPELDIPEFHIIPDNEIYEQEIIEDTIIVPDNISANEHLQQSENLLDRARQLGNQVQQIIIENFNGGGN